MKVPSRILFEFTTIGRSVKVCALDPVNNVEVVIVGDRSAGEETLKRVAARKLLYVLAKRERNRSNP